MLASPHESLLDRHRSDQLELGQDRCQLSRTEPRRSRELVDAHCGGSDAFEHSSTGGDGNKIFWPRWVSAST